MSYFIGGIVGIMGGGVILIIFSLLTMAQRGDAHLEQMCLGEAGGRLETNRTKLGEGPAKPGPQEASQDGAVSRVTDLA